MDILNCAWTITGTLDLVWLGWHVVANGVLFKWVVVPVGSPLVAAPDFGYSSSAKGVLEGCWKPSDVVPR